MHALWLFFTLSAAPMMGCGTPPPAVVVQGDTLTVGCGTCMFKMKGDGCKLAVRFEGKDYFVEGTGIDDHGDAHDQEGFCNAISKAKVQGKVKGDKFKVTYFELLKKEAK